MNPIENQQLCQDRLEAFSEGSVGLAHVPSLVRRIIETGAWRERNVRGHVIELKSFRELIVCKPWLGHRT